MLFYVSKQINCSFGKNVFVLKKDNWDDWFTYETMFGLVYIDSNGISHHLGGVKIGQKNMQEGQRTPNIPDRFYELPDDFFSLGQSDNYYDELNQLGEEIAKEALVSLNDIAYNSDLFDKVKKLDVTKRSLMRDFSEYTIKQQLQRIAHGSARLTSYNIEYTYPGFNDEEPTKLYFSVIPESNPPTNIHAIIGRNNVGKTYLIKNLIQSIYFPEDRDKFGRLRSTNSRTKRMVNATTQAFANVLCVSFSPFDNYDDILELTRKRTAMPFKYIGLSDNNLSDSLKKNFVEGLKNCLSSKKKLKLLDAAITTLETDPIFERSKIKELLNLDANPTDINAKKEEASKLFSKLSSGHQVIVLTIVQLIEKITERTLVILDEPENHLHPPLLAAFIRALSELLIDRNGVAIIATHSPVILQEIPKSCIWKINRSGKEVTASRLEIESFGATIGALTREVFGLEVQQAGFNKMLREAVDSGDSYEDIIMSFNNEIGDEARALLHTLLKIRDDENCDI